MVDTSVVLAGLKLDNPIIPASGTFGYGYEYARYYDINILGSMAIKGTTVERRVGNPQPRIADCPAGLINSVGLQNPGYENVIREELPLLKKYYSKKVLANISGSTVEEYAFLSAAFDKEDAVGIIEVNVSCPNVHDGGLAFGADVKSVKAVTEAVKKATSKPVFIKLSPNVSDIVGIAKACEDAGADGISMVNTYFGMRIDIKRRKPIIALKTGGYSGPGVLPMALNAVYKTYEAVNIPIIGMGGISASEEVVEFMLAGATAVEIGSANLVDPYACKDIIEKLPLTMAKCRIERLSEVIGGGH